MSYDEIHFMRFSQGKYLPIADRYRDLVVDSDQRLQKRWNKRLNIEEILQNVASHSTITEAVVYDEVMRSYLSLNPGQRWGDRSAVNWEGIPAFLKMFPQGKVIHIYRDPRAVLASFKHYTYHPSPMYLDAIFASLAMFNFISHESISNHPNIYLLKYEDLVTDPTSTIHKLCEFLDVKFRKSMLNVGEFLDKNGAPFDGNSSFIKGRKSIDSKSLDLYRQQLSPLDIYFCERIHGSILRDFGYEPSEIEVDENEIETLLENPYVEKRYRYWERNGDGEQAYPETVGSYDQRKRYWNKGYFKYWSERVQEANSNLSKQSSIVDGDSLTSSDLDYFDVLDLLSIQNGDRVLELGCGFGRSIPYLYSRSQEIVAIDISTEMIEAARAKHAELPGIRFEVREAERTGFDNNSFNKIICYAVFDALYQQAMLIEMNRLLENGGTVLLTGKNTDYLDDDNEALVAEHNARTKGHPNYFTDVNLLLDQLDTFGFELLTERYFLKRGDDRKTGFVTTLPPRFYEYLLILKKVKPVTSLVPKEISSAYSKTFLRKENKNNV